MNSDFATIGEVLDSFEDRVDPDAPLAEIAEARYALRRIEEQLESLHDAAVRMLEVTDALADETPIKEAWLALWAEVNADSIPAKSPE